MPERTTGIIKVVGHFSNYETGVDNYERAS